MVEASQGVVQLEGISGTLDLQVVSALRDLCALGSPLTLRLASSHRGFP